jgi:hypothetical protein
MQLHIHIHHHGKPSDDEVLHNVFTLTQSTHAQNQKIMEELAVLTQEVTETKTVMASAVTLLQGLKARLDAAGTDKVKLAELSADLDTNTNALAAAVAANTPSEGEPPINGEGGGGNDNAGSNL